MAVPITEIGELSLCRSFAASQDAEGYSIAETDDRFRRERVAEAALRITGVILVLAGIVHWFLPGVALGGDHVVARSALTAAFIGTGVALYLFASRGFRHALRIDIARRQVGIARLNASGRWLVRRAVPMARIESLVIKRPTPRQPLADLRVRIAGRHGSFSAMRGRPDEIEALHRRLCLDIRLTLRTGGVSPARVKRRGVRFIPLFQTRRPRRNAA